MLTLQFIPYTTIEELSSSKRVAKLLQLVKANKIIMLEGRLKSDEEAELIRKTMEDIDDKFTGIELSVVYPELKNAAFFTKLKHTFINFVLGDRQGMTIIGPANIVKEIKQDPEKIQLLTKDYDEKKVVKRRK
jgi:hypothetical protein